MVGGGLGVVGVCVWVGGWVGAVDTLYVLAPGRLGGITSYRNNFIDYAWVSGRGGWGRLGRWVVKGSLINIYQKIPG